MGMTLEDLRKLIHKEIDSKIDLVTTETSKLEDTRKQLEAKLDEVRAAAEAEVKTFWKTHGRVVLVAGCIGLALGIILASIGAYMIGGAT